MENKDYKELSDFLESGRVPARLTSKEERRTFKRRASKYLLQDGSLRLKKAGKLLRVVKQQEVNELLVRYHCLLGAHKGQNATWRSLANEFHWPGMYNTVKEFVQNCDRCQRNNATLTTTPALHPISVNTTLFDRWGIDLAGPYRTSSKGNKFVVIATEYLTRWVEAAAIPNKSALQIAAFFKELVCRFGVMNFLQSDQGTEFCNAIVDNLEKMLGFKHKVSAAYHPQTNGLVERTVQTVKQ